MKQVILIVGASGVGKDTLLKNIKEKKNINFIYHSLLISFEFVPVNPFVNTTSGEYCEIF